MHGRHGTSPALTLPPGPGLDRRRHQIVEELEERLTPMMIETLIADIETYWKLPKPVPKPAKDGSAAPAASDAGGAGTDLPATMEED